MTDLISILLAAPSGLINHFVGKLMLIVSHLSPATEKWNCLEQNHAITFLLEKA